MGNGMIASQDLLVGYDSRVTTSVLLMPVFGDNIAAVFGCSSKNTCHTTQFDLCYIVRKFLEVRGLHGPKICKPKLETRGLRTVRLFLLTLSAMVFNECKHFP